MYDGSTSCVENERRRMTSGRNCEVEEVENLKIYESKHSLRNEVDRKKVSKMM